jgi:hypothetical protein
LGNHCSPPFFNHFESKAMGYESWFGPYRFNCSSTEDLFQKNLFRV